MYIDAMSQGTAPTAHIASGLARLAAFLRAAQWDQAESVGLTATQGQILVYLEQRGASRITAVAAELGVTQPTASDSVAALQRKGLLSKRRDPSDARAVLLHPTAAGRKLARSLMRQPDSLQAALESLAADEQAALLRGLSKTIRELQHRGAIPVQRLCVGCRFFRPYVHDDPEAPHHCEFVGAAFGEADLRLDCSDHEAAAPAAAEATWRQFTCEQEAE